MPPLGVLRSGETVTPVLLSSSRPDVGPMDAREVPEAFLRGNPGDAAVSHSSMLSESRSSVQRAQSSPNAALLQSAIAQACSSCHFRLRAE